MTQHRSVPRTRSADLIGAVAASIPSSAISFINSHDRGEVTKMVPRTAGRAEKGSPGGESTQPAYVRKNAGNIVNPATHWPCQSPPWGELFAINVNTGDVAWRLPFGKVPSLEALGFKDTGSYNIGGSVATAGGVLFIGATDDQLFHAYESKTGKLLWETKLPANGYANPITYQGKDGKQYVVIAANEDLVAYRLPWTSGCGAHVSQRGKLQACATYRCYFKR